ncbi:hypothetical protein Pmani_016246 [Petrolisthes manimaculis]|uniref:Uncharacterized protein n=1 Tax=Petrolisthes manimaculis TaxID=1843537 RepID=A0AAE1U6W8_9EUCA|nr:hypothetical protein Pmani_016246 [Petrolisthes manimaculis]
MTRAGRHKDRSEIVKRGGRSEVELVDSGRQSWAPRGWGWRPGPQLGGIQGRSWPGGREGGRKGGLEGDGRRGPRMRVMTLLKIAGVAAVVRSSGGGRLCCAAAVWLHLV